MTLYEKATWRIQYEINKHGSYGRAETVEVAVNALSQDEFLQLISDAFEELKAEEKGT